jgi:large subunit ribosomal protein L33
MRVNLFLTCVEVVKRGAKITEKRHKNYRTSKAKKPQGEKLSLKKYCKFCRKTTNHKEEVIK